jgi:putative acetyltransferase
MGFDIRPMTIADHDEAVTLWRSCEGIGLSGADEREPVRRYLERSPGLSFVAREDERLVGAVLCGHDGRRGYVHHLAVTPSVRGRGLGRALVARCFAALRVEGIRKCHLFVFRANAEAARFWRRTGWDERTDLYIFSRETPDVGVAERESGEGPRVG